MRKTIFQKKSAIKELARRRDPENIQYFKRIALDRNEHVEVRKEAVMAIGGFDWRAIEPLTEIAITTKDEKQCIGKSAFRLLHALNQSEHRERWDQATQLKLNAAVWACAGLLEGLA